MSLLTREISEIQKEKGKAEMRCKSIKVGNIGKELSFLTPDISELEKE